MLPEYARSARSRRFAGTWRANTHPGHPEANPGLPAAYALTCVLNLAADTLDRRDAAAAQRALDALRSNAEGDGNLMPPIVAAVKARCTLGGIGNASALSSASTAADTHRVSDPEGGARVPIPAKRRPGLALAHHAGPRDVGRGPT